MAYISYTDVPLYFGTGVNSNTLPGEAIASNKTVFAQNVQLNYTPNIAPTRVVGRTVQGNDFNLAGPPNASLSFTCYLESSEFDPFDYTGDVGDIGAAFRLGDEVNGISGSGAFLTSLSFTVAPYSPILIQCDFAIYNPLTTTNTGGEIASAPNSDSQDASFDTFAHGAYSTFSGAGIPANGAGGELSDIDTVESVQYQFSTQRLPVYEIGSYTLKKCEQITAEQALNIQGDNIQKIVPITGDTVAALSLQLKKFGGSTLGTVTFEKGQLNTENVTIQGGDLARGSIAITQLLK